MQQGGFTYKDKQVFVGGLPLNVTEEELRNEFEAVGRVEKTKVTFSICLVPFLCGRECL